MAQQRELFNSCQGCTLKDDDEMVQCDTCNSWYHYRCAGPNITDDIVNYKWQCDCCIIGQKLTLQSDRSSTNLPNLIRLSTRPVDRINEVNSSVKTNQILALELMEAQRKLEEERWKEFMAIREEQMNKSFEIQSKFLRERYNILKQSENDILDVTSPTDQNKSVNNWFYLQRDLTSNQVHSVALKSSKTDVDRNVKLGSSTPIRTPSTKFEGIATEMSSIKFQNKENSTQERHEFQVPRQSVEPKQQENLFVPNLTSKYQQLFLKSLQESTSQSNLRDITNLGNKQWSKHQSQPETSRKTIISSQPVHQSNIQWLNPQQASVSTITVEPTMLNSNQIAARHVLPRDLSKFFGSPKEWPMFISSYESSTLTGGYTNAENLIRLQRCLQGKAMDAVRSILLTPDNVPNVIETLRMMYGRPDLIIHTLVQQIKEEQPPRMEKLETIINYALVVKNLCAVIQSTRLDSHMNNPYLMQEILDKLPSPMKLEWSRYKRTLPNVTMISLGDWLYDVAKAASDVVTPEVPRDRGKATKGDVPTNSQPSQELYQPPQQ